VRVAAERRLSDAAGTAGELHHESIGELLVIKWKKLFQKNRENISLVEKLLEEVASRRVSKVIIDMTESSGTFPDEFMAWAQGPGMVRSAQVGVRYYVTVDPASAVSKLSVTRWQNVASQNVHGIELTSVPSRKTAEDWLRPR
jgi:hypothetical protein